METTLLADPVKVGPGVWFKMHVDAVDAVTDELKNAFILSVNRTCDRFKCKECRTHFRKYIDTHPFQNYWNIRDPKGRDVGFYKWTWELHNKVNERLGKPLVGLEESYIYYADSEVGVCHNCHNKPALPPYTPQISTPPSSSIPPIIVNNNDRRISPIISFGSVHPFPMKLIARE